MNTQGSRTETAGAAGQYAELLQRTWEPYVRLFQQFTPANTALPDLGKLQQRYVDFASAEGAAAYRKLSQLSADYYSALLNTSVTLSEEFYRQVYQTRAQPSAAVPRPSPPLRELVFTGPIGSTVSRAFVVSNRTNRPAKVSFELSEFVKDNGPEKVRLDAQLTPGSFDLAGQGERTIDCSVPLTEALKPGCEYRAMVRVIGFPDMKIGFLVKPQSAPQIAKTKPRKAAKARGKKRKS